MKNEILTACDQVVSAMVNGVYQGIILAILVALGLRLLRRTNAATRHAVWFCTLLLLVSLMVANLLRDRAFAKPASKVDNIADIPTLESALVTTAALGNILGSPTSPLTPALSPSAGERVIRQPHERELRASLSPAEGERAGVRGRHLLLVK